MATDTNLNQLVINKLTRAQYEAAKNAGQTVNTELYMITDADSEVITPESIGAATSNHTHDNYSTATNLIDGSAEGSLRMIGTSQENSDYTIGEYSFAEGELTCAEGYSAHAEGILTHASGVGAHAEGEDTVASGDYSHSEGDGTVASGDRSHAEGYNTTASGKNQHVQGKYNVEDTNLAHIVGNGSSSTRSNAHTIDWSGNAWFAGDVYVSSTSGINKDAGSVRLATETYVDNAVANVMTQAFHAGTSAPSNTSLLWIDTTANTGGLKYHNGNGWVHVPVAYT